MGNTAAKLKELLSSADLKDEDVESFLKTLNLDPEAYKTIKELIMKCKPVKNQNDNRLACLHEVLTAITKYQTHKASNKQTTIFGPAKQDALADFEQETVLLNEILHHNNEFIKSIELMRLHATDLQLQAEKIQRTYKSTLQHHQTSLSGGNEYAQTIVSSSAESRFTPAAPQMIQVCPDADVKDLDKDDDTFAQTSVTSYLNQPTDAFIMSKNPKVTVNNKAETELAQIYNSSKSCFDLDNY